MTQHETNSKHEIQMTGGCAAFSAFMNSVIRAWFGFRVWCFVFRFCAAACLLVASLLVAGCKQAGDEGKRVPVIGKVTFADGKPLPRGTVIFTPDGAKGNESQHEPRGPISADGSYKLSTTTRLDGVAPGAYLVTIIAQEPYDEKKSDWDPPWIINRKYGNRQTSGLAAQVIENPDPGRYDFQVSK